MKSALFGGKAFAAFLFDMDGTLLSSVEAAERVWRSWALRQGLDVDSFIPSIHGVRSADTIRRLALPGIDPEVEAAAITQAEILDVRGVTPIAGAAALVALLPRSRWAIVTSAPRALALARLRAAGLQPPAVLVTAEDVSHGKPDPEGYRRAAQLLGVAAQQCLVFEDAAAGIEAAERASAAVLIVTATHSGVRATTHPQIKNYECLSLSVDSDGMLTLVRSA